MNVKVSVPVFGQTHRFAFEFDTVPINRFVVVGVRTRKADHPPRHHVAVSAVHRIAEKSLHGHCEQQAEKNDRRHTVEIRIAGLEYLEIAVLGVGSEVTKSLAARLEIPVDCPNRRVEKLTRRERQLIALGGSARLPRPAAVQSLARAPRTAQLLI